MPTPRNQRLAFQILNITIACPAVSDEVSYVALTQSLKKTTVTVNNG